MKPFYKSLTYWSLLLSAVGTVLAQSGFPVLGNIMCAIGGTGIIYGRSRAQGPLKGMER